ncbi:MAG TPA: universal stress protein [Thermoanaerobaculia bacterium]|nr:universal stress protein [Thermoanaerobaculia bacterium]
MTQGEPHFQQILVPTDMNPTALDALRYAKMLAQRFAGGVTLLYVDPIVFPTAGFGVDGPMYFADAPYHSEYLESELRKYAEDVLKDVKFATATAAGQPVPLILQEAKKRRADVIVMSTHGLTGWRRAIIGSVTQGVLHGGDVPVLSIRRSEVERPEVAIRKIVCPINFTTVASDALDYAELLAKRCDAELVVAHVAEQQDAGRGAALRSWVDARLKTAYREVSLRGGAAERVLDLIDDVDADLLVIGAQHKLFRDETVIGATTERLVRFARVPVLSVPRPAAAVQATKERRAAAVTA